MTDSPAVQQLLAEIGMPDYAGRPGQWWPGTVVQDVIIGTGEGLRTIDPLWWFLLVSKDGQLKPDRKMTCFNARNLGSRLWKQPLRTHRCVIPATSIVETKDKNSFHMEAEEGLLIGGLYRVWEQGGHLVHSCTVITCPPHVRFSEYHEKSIPLFLPMDVEMVRLWLDPTFHEVDYFKGMIDNARLTADLKVTPVKNSRDLAALGPTVMLERDPDEASEGLLLRS